MPRIFIFFCTLVLIIASISCGSKANVSSPLTDTPTEAYKRLFAAVKAKDINMIKAQVSKRTIELGNEAAKRYGKPESSMFENGFTATTYEISLPEIRDERIKDNVGAIEVWNAKDNHWEDLPFIIEDGRWKLALGELFAGTLKFPSPSREVNNKGMASSPTTGSLPNSISNSSSQVSTR